MGALQWISDTLGFGDSESGSGRSIIAIVQEHADRRFHVTTDPVTGDIVTATPGALEAIAAGEDIYSEVETDQTLLKGARSNRLSKVALVAAVAVVVVLAYLLVRRRSAPRRRRRLA